MARWCITAQIVAAPVNAVANLGGGGVGRAFILATIAGAVVGAVAVVGTIAGLVHLRRLASRLPRPGLARQTGVVLWGYGACQALGIVFAIAVVMLLPMVMVPPAAPAPGTPPPAPSAAVMSALVGQSRRRPSMFWPPST